MFDCQSDQSEFKVLNQHKVGQIKYNLSNWFEMHELLISTLKSLNYTYLL